MAAASKQAEMFQPIEPTSVVLAGVPLNLRPRDIYRGDHPAVKKWPHFFKPADPLTGQPPIRPDVEQTTAAPGEKRGAK